MKRFLSMMLLVSLSSSMLLGDCPWSFIYHDSNNSNSNPCETSLSSSNVGGLFQVWADTSASVSLTPVIKNGFVYYGNAANIFQRGDAQCGTPLASVTIPGGFGSPATVTDTAVYVSTNDLVLHILDPLTLLPLPAFPTGI